MITFLRLVFVRQFITSSPILTKFPIPWNTSWTKSSERRRGERRREGASCSGAGNWDCGERKKDIASSEKSVSGWKEKSPKENQWKNVIDAFAGKPHPPAGQGSSAEPCFKVTVIIIIIIIILSIITVIIVMVCAQNTYGTNTYRYLFRRYSFRASSSSSSSLPFSLFQVFQNFPTWPKSTKSILM